MANRLPPFFSGVGIRHVSDPEGYFLFQSKITGGFGNILVELLEPMSALPHGAHGANRGAFDIVFGENADLATRLSHENKIFLKMLSHFGSHSDWLRAEPLAVTK